MSAGGTSSVEARGSAREQDTEHVAARGSAREQNVARRAGYTLIEVMVGVLISAIGIAGISFMQSASVRGNQDAYESTVATNFARTWLERVKRDALLWRTPGAPLVGAMFPARGVPVSNYFVPGAGWTVPRPLLRPAGFSQESSGANFHGIEIGSPSDPLDPASAAVDTRQIYYCLNLRFNTVQVDALGRDVAMGVDARVYWARKGSLSASAYTNILPMRNDPAGCDNPAYHFTDPQMLANTECALDGTVNYCMRVHYLRTVIRMVPP
jgi:prepilin-type N-terminal cleavage/methylation domain-containing protein